MNPAELKLFRKKVAEFEKVVTQYMVSPPNQRFSLKEQIENQQLFRQLSGFGAAAASGTLAANKPDQTKRISPAGSSWSESSPRIFQCWQTAFKSNLLGWTLPAWDHVILTAFSFWLKKVV